MITRLSQQAQEVVALAGKEARERNFSHIGSESLLIGLLSDQNCWSCALLNRFGVTLERARVQVAMRVAGGDGGSASEPVPFTPRAEQALARGNRESLDHDDGDVGTEHILFGLAAIGEGEGMNALRDLGLSSDVIRGAVADRLAGQRARRHPH